MDLIRNPTFTGAAEDFRQEILGRGLSARQKEYIDSLPRIETKSEQNREILAELHEGNADRAKQNRLPNSEWMKRMEFERRGKLMHHLTFLKKLRAHGVRCWYNEEPFRGIVGLRAMRRGYEGLGLQFICGVKAGWTTEYDIFNYDRYGAELNKKFIGWRTVVFHLIAKKILTEHEANRIFGRPLENEASKLYRQNLWFLRNC